MATKKAGSAGAASKAAKTTKKSATGVAVKRATAKGTGDAPEQRTSAKTTAAKKSAAPAKSPAAKKSATTKKPGAHAAPGKTSTDEKYTDPALRERIKAKVVREGKGGRPGQWSARKAQMVAHEYEAEGGGYKGGRNETQQSLTHWGEEHWQTADGQPAQREDGMHRYLPEKAWEELSPAEKKATEKKKLAGDKQGKQFVSNTGAAVKARRNAEKEA